MFYFRHPRPVVDGRAVAVQIVQQKEAAKPQAQVLVAASRTQPPATPEAAPKPLQADNDKADDAPAVTG